MKNQKGFTLIELLLVLAIIGIISAIAIPALLGQRERAKATATKDNTVAIVGDLQSVIGELSDAPSQRKTSYPPDVYAASATGNKAKADAAITLVMARANFAGAKNPYDGSAAFVVGAASVVDANAGKVSVDATSANVASQPVITVTGVWKDANGVATSSVKTVTVD